MAEIPLEVQVRPDGESGTAKARAVRRQNFIPGIVYGGKKKPTAIKLDKRTFEKIRRIHHGELVFRLNVMEGEKKLRDYSAIVKEEQHDPVTDEILHVDFNRISLTDKITVKVNIVAKGEPVGVKKDGGSLEHILWQLDVICLPTQIPQELTVEVSHLKIGDSVYVKDIVLPEGIATKHDMEGIVFTVVPPAKEEELVAPEAAAPTEVEVIKEKKVEGEEKKSEEAKEKKEEKKEEKKKEEKK